MSHLVIPITITMVVEDIATVLLTYDQIQVHRSTDGATGTYAEITTAKTRVVLIAGQTQYTFEDEEGSEEYWYKFRYYNSGTLVEGAFSTAERGANDPALDVLSIYELKTNYLFGLDLTKDDGEPYPDSMFAFFIRQAVSWLEHRLDIKISRVQFTEERHDYFKDDYKEWMFMKLHHCPVISVESVRMVLPGEQEVHDFDDDWIHIQRESGQLQLVPGIGSMGNIMLGATGMWMPMYRRMSKFVPDVFRVAYTAGFGVKRGAGVSPSAPDFDAVPDMIKELVGKVASFGPLNIAGDLLGGAGIASQAISIDGLSQSFNTTCLMPETEITLGNDGVRTIIELAEWGKLFDVKSLDLNQEPVVAPEAKAFATIKTRLWRVLLDNKHQIGCSADHLFMLRDGRWAEAAKLEPGIELMPTKGLAGDSVQVLEIHKTNEIKQMYDLRVPNYERFALKAGVVVHNSSSTSAGYGARLIQFSKEIKAVLPELRRYYRGISLAVV